MRNPIQIQRFKFAFILFALLFTARAQAVYVSQDSRYIYHSTPYTQYLSDSNQLQFVMETSYRVVVNHVLEMASQNMVPKEILSIDDLRKLEESNQNFDKQISIVNRWIRQAKKRKSGLRRWDRVPDAFYFFFGAKVSGGAGASIGFGPTLGVVVMPTHVKQIDKATGEVQEYTTFNTETVILVSGNYGVGVGGGSTLRIGMGFIWGSDHFVDPSQFVGAGGGLSGSAVLPMIGGMNAKLGFLMSLDASMPDTIDFYYATLAWERGFAGTAEAHVSGTFVYSLEQFLQKMGIVGLEQRENYLNNQMQHEIETLYAEMDKPSLGTGQNLNDAFRAKANGKDKVSATNDKKSDAQQATEQTQDQK